MPYDVRPCSGHVAEPQPKDRVTVAPAFSVSDVDLAGPVYCVDFRGAEFYICLLVCGIIRAVHLELLDSFSTNDFVLSFRRFAALRRMPSIVYLNNVASFTCGEKKLVKLLGVFCAQWKFICPPSSW